MIYFRGNNNYYATSYFSYNQFIIQGNKIYSGGNLMSLCDFANFVEEYAFVTLFKDCESLISLPHITGINSIDQRGFYQTFQGCSNVKVMPEIDTNLQFINDYAFAGTFQYCTSLKEVTIPNADTYRQYAFRAMFESTNINKATVLCEYLDDSGLLEKVFQNCPNLTEIISYITNPYSSYLNLWLNNNTQAGDFYKVSNATYSRNSSGIPSNWTIHNM